MEGLENFPAAGVVHSCLFVPRSGGEEWLGRVEGDGVDVVSSIVECLDIKIRNDWNWNSGRVSESKPR